MKPVKTVVTASGRLNLPAWTGPLPSGEERMNRTQAGKGIGLEWGNHDGRPRIVRINYPSDFPDERIAELKRTKLANCPFCSVLYSLSPKTSSNPRAREAFMTSMTGWINKVPKLSGLVEALSKRSGVKSDQIATIFGSEMFAWLFEIPINAVSSGIGRAFIKLGIGAVITAVTAYAPIKDERLNAELMEIASHFFARTFSGQQSGVLAGQNPTELGNMFRKVRASFAGGRFGSTVKEQLSGLGAKLKGSFSKGPFSGMFGSSNLKPDEIKAPTTPVAKRVGYMMAGGSVPASYAGVSKRKSAGGFI